MPEIQIQMHKRKKVVGKRWRMDEPYSKVVLTKDRLPILKSDNVNT
jgi:transposase-like protein